MRRWTDGKSWSASRVSGSFLTYREMEGKRGGSYHSTPLARAGRTPDSTRGSDSDIDMGGDEGPDGYRYKPDGLMKQSFSITTSTGNHLHLISYYSRAPAAQGLMQPAHDPALRHIRPQKGMYPESTVHDQQNIPAVTRTPMATPPAAQVQQVNAYPRPGQQMAYGPPSVTHWPSPPPCYAHYPSAGLPPPPMGYAPVPLQYSQPMAPLPQAAIVTSYPNGGTSTPPIDNLPRPHIPNGHHRSTSASSYPTYLPNPSPHLGHASQVSSASTGNSPSSTPPMSKIDPRLVNPSPLSHHQSLPGVHKRESATRTPSPAPKREFSATPTSRDTILTNASTIPSIGALVNSASEAQVAGSRSGSRSPGGSRSEKGPQDIPHSKLGFGEDMRALRVLDRAFKT